MDWKQFISSIAESFAWPISAIILVLILRTQLGKLMEKIYHVKYKDLELDFEKVKEQAKAIAASEKKLKQISPATASPILASLEDSPERSPVEFGGRASDEFSQCVEQFILPGLFGKFDK